MSEQTAVTEPVTIASAMAAAETPAQEAPASEPAATTSTEPTSTEVEAASIPTYTVKVGGDTFEVTLEEALAGYQRQQDYTRKTQEVAAERSQLSQAQQLWDAIEANPQRTIAAIAEAYGYDLAKPGAQTEASPLDAFNDDEGTPNTADAEFRARVEAFIADQQAQQAQSAVDRELAAVHAKYNVKFDDMALVQYAVDNGINNLDAAFRLMSVEAAERVAQERKSKQAVGQVAPGHPVTTGTVTPGSGNKLPSLAEAFAAAESAHLGE